MVDKSLILLSSWPCFSGIAWSVEGKDLADLESTDKLVTEADSITSYLNISSHHFTDDDAISKIVCTATNSVGEDHKVFVVSVRK